MSKPPEPGFDGDEIHPVRDYVVATNTGFRRWYVMDWDRPLASLSWPYYWEGAGPHRSREVGFSDWFATPSDTWPEMPPALNNPVGFYAYYNVNGSVYTGDGTEHKVRVDGVIEGYGRCVIGTKGFRAECALILAFSLAEASWRYDGQILKGSQTAAQVQDGKDKLREYLDRFYPTVPVFDSKVAMLEMFPLSRKPFMTHGDE